MNPSMPGLEVWFVTGSQHLYGPETLEHVAEHLAQIARGASRPGRDPGQRRLQAGADQRRRRSAALPGGQRRPLRRAHRLDAHLLAGQDVDRRADALQKPLAHLHTQFNRDIPWATIDMDFMNLNQSAHGDREFGFIGSRLRLQAQGGRRPLAGSRRCRPPGRVGARGLRLARYAGR